MRLIAVLGLSAALFLVLGSLCCGAVLSFDSPTVATAARPTIDSLVVPTWPAFLFLGYISMGLKRQLGRRGYQDGQRTESYSDLIFLRRKDLPPPPSSAEDSRHGNTPPDQR